MRHRTPASTLGMAFALLLLPAAVAAQTAGSAPTGTRPAGCRGTNSESTSVTAVGRGGQPVVFPGYATVTDVQKDSPAEAAGMQVGDRVLRQNGRDLVADPPAQPSLAGDTVQLLVLRGEAEVPLTVVLGRWDPPQGDDRVCIRVEPATRGR